VPILVFIAIGVVVVVVVVIIVVVTITIGGVPVIDVLILIAIVILIFYYYYYLASRCLFLRALDVSGCSIRDETLHVLAEAARVLEDLNIAGCLHVSSGAIRTLAHSRESLRNLAISRSPTADSWFTDTLLSELPRLELSIEPARVPPSLRWHPLPFAEFG
jgi:hypothetical protein